MIGFFTGPKGGRYYLNGKGKKVYIKKGTEKAIVAKFSNTRNNKAIKFRQFVVNVANYEHEEDLTAEIDRIKKICPEARNFNAWADRDKEAEAEYIEEYGKLEEPIYVGYVEFEAPENYESRTERA